MRYLVVIREVHKQEVLIEADSPEEAMAKVQEGEGENGELDYDYTLEPDTWDVEENPKGKNKLNEGNQNMNDDREKFNPDLWECAGCARKGTLCSKQIKVTTFHPVTGIVNGDVLIGGDVIRRNGRFDGYVCWMCGMVVANGREELLEQYES